MDNDLGSYAHGLIGSHWEWDSSVLPTPLRPAQFVGLVLDCLLKLSFLLTVSKTEHRQVILANTAPPRTHTCKDLISMLDTLPLPELQPIIKPNTKPCYISDQQKPSFARVAPLRALRLFILRQEAVVTFPRCFIYFYARLGSKAKGLHGGISRGIHHLAASHTSTRRGEFAR